MRVTKSGRTSGTTSGIIDGVTIDEFTVIPDPRNPPPNGEISEGGDSGSLWFVSTSSISLFPGAGVGLHFAGEITPDPNSERAWAKQILSVATALNIRFQRA
jgi:endonuclease G